MIITRSPLRISVGGGGTDLPSYYEKNGGTVFSSLAINKHIYISLNKRFLDTILIRYLENEEVSDVKEIKHDIIRETLKRLSNDFTGIEITSTSDVPGGTGLGSSGAFGVALQMALRQYANINIDKFILASESTIVEKDILLRPIGLQDQYISSFGGLTEFTVLENGNVSASRNINTTKTLEIIKDNLFLYFTDYSRDASTILADQSKEMSDSKRSGEFGSIIEMGKFMYQSLVNADLDSYADCMHDYWMLKRERQKNHTLSAINEVYDHLYTKKLISGGKLVGAGGTGFLLLASKTPSKLHSEMEKFGLKQLEFDIDNDGAKVVQC